MTLRLHYIPVTHLLVAMFIFHGLCFGEGWEPRHIENMRYPGVARAASHQGSVIVEAVLSNDGDVVTARALSGPDILSQAAVSNLLQWKFRRSPSLPTTSQDRKQLVLVIFIFRLSGLCSGPCRDQFRFEFPDTAFVSSEKPVATF